MDAASLQNVIDAQAIYDTSSFDARSLAVTLQTDSTRIDAAINALNALVTPLGYNSGGDFYFQVPLTVTLNLSSGSYHDVVVSLQPDVTLVINGVDGGTTIVGHSPALTIAAGNVIVNHVALTTATDAPTVLVSGGRLTLRDDDIQESTGFSDAAVSVTGDLATGPGTADDPGGDTIHVNGARAFIRNTTADPIVAVDDAFEVNGQAWSGPSR